MSVACRKWGFASQQKSPQKLNYTGQKLGGNGWQRYLQNYKFICKLEISGAPIDEMFDFLRAPVISFEMIPYMKRMEIKPLDHGTTLVAATNGAAAPHWAFEDRRRASDPPSSPRDLPAWPRSVVRSPRR